MKSLKWILIHITFKSLQDWEGKLGKYKSPVFKFKVRDKELSVKTHSESLSHLSIPKVAVPRYSNWGDRLKWSLQENFPGRISIIQLVCFLLKERVKIPTRMFAGEGGPERTNRRFHYVSLGMPAKRLVYCF